MTAASLLSLVGIQDILLQLPPRNRIPSIFPPRTHSTALQPDQHPQTYKHKNPPPKMDPYSSEGELINIHAAFHQYQYDSVLSDFDPSSFSAENRLPARVLQLRARVALGQARDVLDEVKGEQQQPELAAVSALATLGLGDADKAAGLVEDLLSRGGDAAAENAIVQVLGGGVLAAAGKGEEALALLGRHQGNRELNSPEGGGGRILGPSLFGEEVLG